jgi:DnaK suppressor protein
MPSAKELDRLKKALNDARDRLVNNHAHMEEDAHFLAGSSSSVKFNHQADAGSDTFEMDFSMEQMENSDQLIYSIDQALIRMQDGSYGDCEICGKKINVERLKAIPFASNCLGCQEDMEKN